MEGTFVRLLRWGTLRGLDIKYPHVVVVTYKMYKVTGSTAFRGYEPPREDFPRVLLTLEIQEHRKPAGHTGNTGQESWSSFEIFIAVTCNDTDTTPLLHTQDSFVCLPRPVVHAFSQPCRHGHGNG